MAIQFRETRSRFRERALFLGLNTSPVPVVAAAVVSVLLLLATTMNYPEMSLILRLITCGAPFYLTIAYIWGFKTNRRPSLDRDVFMWLINGNVASPVPPSKQPIHPGLPYRSQRRRPKCQLVGEVYHAKSAR
jgi:hypothetical protein